ncbi:MAG: tRNA lysidine(34) synthetase TilS [Acidimicrobiales bacterium]
MLSPLAASLLGRCVFPAKGEPLACAVSGGADSLALLALAVAAGCEATAYHVDHGIRPGSAGEADVVRAGAERLGAGFIGLRVEVAAGPNLEARARAARFAVLPPDVATGHTAEDQAETVLLNLLRGAGAGGLAGMRVGRRHPILRLRRAETVRLVESLGLEVVTDPSNTDPLFRRNRIRSELVPLLSDVAGRDVVAVIVRQAELIADDVALLDDLAAGIDASSAAELTNAPVALARRAVRAWLKDESRPPYPPDAATVERVLAVARGEALACEIPGGRRLRRSQGRLVLEA